MPIRCAHYRGQSRFLLILHTILCHCMCIVTAKTKQNHTQNTHTNLFLFQPCLFLGLTSGLYLLSIQLTSCVSGFNTDRQNQCVSLIFCGMRACKYVRTCVNFLSWSVQVDIIITVVFIFIIIITV